MKIFRFLAKIFNKIFRALKPFSYVFYKALVENILNTTVCYDSLHNHMVAMGDFNFEDENHGRCKIFWQVIYENNDDTLKRMHNATYLCFNPVPDEIIEISWLKIYDRNNKDITKLFDYGKFWKCYCEQLDKASDDVIAGL